MKKYYTRVCNFYYGSRARNLIKNKRALPLNGNLEISFDHIEIFSRKNTKLVHLKDIKKLPLKLKKKINEDLKKILKRKKNFSNFNFNKLPNIMGVLNLTPDSFSDGGKFNKVAKAEKHISKMIMSGAKIIDVGGESTRPGSKTILDKAEWKRVKNIVSKFKKSHKKACS